MSVVSFKTGTQATYDNQVTIPSNILYFATDTNRIYKGSVLYAANTLRAVSALPRVGVEDTFYWDTVNEKLYLYHGEFIELSNSGTIDPTAVVTSINGETGDITLTIPTATSDLTNDSNFISDAGVTSVNGSTGDVTLTIPTKVSDLTNDSHFMTSFTESDPIFQASAASTITNGNISAWNNKQNALTFDSVPSSGSDNPVTSDGIYNAIASLSTAMKFKGTLGTGGSITALPAAAASNTGDTYKVITAGTYQPVVVSVGDIVVSNGTEWIVIPSGDDENLVLSVNGQTGAVNITIPTATSQLTNDSNFITNAGVTSFNGGAGDITYTAPVSSVNSQTGDVSITAASIGALTEHQSLSNYSTTTEVQAMINAAIATIVDANSTSY